MNKQNKQPVAIDLFAGAGGLSEGLLSAGFNVTVAIEGHPHPALTHAFNHSKTTVLCGDIRLVTVKKLMYHVERNTGSSKVDLIAGGPPCQGFSSAGKRDKQDPRNKLIHEFVRIVEAINPNIFIFENVPGLGRFYGGTTLHTVLDKFWEIGYEIHGIDNQSDFYPEDYPITDSSLFGVPQQRRRLILVGWKKGAIQQLPWHTTNNNSHSQSTSSVTVNEAISDLDFLSGGYECHTYQSKPQSQYQNERRKNSRLLFNHLATKHRVATVNMFRRFKPGSSVNSIDKNYRTGKQRVYRLCPDKVSPAVLALPDDYIHPRRHRIPTVRELARLQSFDDDYVFLGKRTTSDKNRRVDVPQYTQVGNAVPPLLAKKLGETILTAFGYDTCDLRDLDERSKRHSWILGSSGFHGYELSEEAEDSIDLISLDNSSISLPICLNRKRKSNQNIGIVNWTKQRRRKLNYNSK